MTDNETILKDTRITLTEDEMGDIAMRNEYVPSFMWGTEIFAPSETQKFCDEYAWFVDAVTSPASCDTSEFVQRVEVLNQEDPSFAPRLLTGALGLTGEAGEVADVIKKTFFHGHPLDEQKLVKEMGDVMWYLQQICLALNISLREVIEGNREKLQKRYSDNKFSVEESLNRKE